MKLLILSICTLFLVHQSEQQDTIKVITIMKTTMNMETITAISCGEEWKLYPQDTFYIYDKEIQCKIFQLLKEGRPIKNYFSCVLIPVQEFS